MKYFLIIFYLIFSGALSAQDYQLISGTVIKWNAIEKIDHESTGHGVVGTILYDVELEGAYIFNDSEDMFDYDLKIIARHRPTDIVGSKVLVVMDPAAENNVAEYWAPVQEIACIYNKKIIDKLSKALDEAQVLHVEGDTQCVVLYR